MAGFFDNLFDDDEPQGFFGGYRPRVAIAPPETANGPNVSLAIPVSDTAPAPNSATGGTPPDILTYPDGTPVVGPNGNSYPRPPDLDVPANIAIGKQLAPLADLVPQLEAPLNDRDAHMIGLFAAGRPMDYQRPNGYLAALRGDVKSEYRNVTNYNMGAVAAAAGYSKDEALYGAGLYNRIRGRPQASDTRYGIQQDAVDDITQGWEDSTAGKWAAPGSQ